ncbi:hypothetical protein M427DRAFT_51606 [Gonapodya prolifera JEL478]|uniref:Ubiquitin 3 binding protein But2 C-terminal domain-containing protein n=1 Tax=Gonapodya prolifera (strain JEL478) TaxID=1344416 RepID=A0A139AXE9_GONPJ|nr:hypothetical protein M427DRAFT_51606 [Gonapodya prolifera JEL478]|eukprot:KXS21387.1 hypothetical protein M427DRAFT_51606 [Gonapodya prolifera JEL478]
MCIPTFARSRCLSRIWPLVYAAIAVLASKSHSAPLANPLPSLSSRHIRSAVKVHAQEVLAPNPSNAENTQSSISNFVTRAANVPPSVVFQFPSVPLWGSQQAPEPVLYTGEVYNILLNFTYSPDNSTRYAFGTCNITAVPTFVGSEDENSKGNAGANQYMQTPVLMDWTTFVDSPPAAPLVNYISWRVPSRRDTAPLPMYPGRYIFLASVLVFDLYNVSTSVDYADPSSGVGQFLITAQSGVFVVREAI